MSFGRRLIDMLPEIDAALGDRMTTKATRTVKLDEAIADVVKAEAKRRRLNVQDFLEDCVRTGLKVRGIDVQGDGR